MATIKMGKVRLKADYVLPWDTDKILPAGSTGIVEEGPYCSGTFDWSKERPVKFNNYEELGIATYVAIPTELLEVIN